MFEIKYKRYYPTNFFNSNNEKMGTLSISEQLSRAIIIHTLDIGGDRIVKGSPLNKQPDYIIDKKNGLEVTFAASSMTIKRILAEQFDVADIEREVITSVTEACNRKKDKVFDGNYSSVENTGLFMIGLDPIFPWYQEYYGGIEEGLHGNRDYLFLRLYENYIATGIFTNIYLLIITELENYILFSIKEFKEKHDHADEWLKEIDILDKTVLPYYKATSFMRTAGPDINYIIEDVIWF